MPKSVQDQPAKPNSGQASKFRTTPIASTITPVRQLPASAILYLCAASRFWQFRVYLEGAQRKRSTKRTDLSEAQREAKLIYADMLQSIHGSERGKLKLSSTRTLQAVAASLWDKQEVLVAQGELNPQKNRNEQYVFERHIRPFFKDRDLKDINADTLEQFKAHLARQRLAKSTQKGYFNIVAKLLQEAVKKQYIHAVPVLPRVRMDDEPRGYFNPVEYTQLWKRAQSLTGKTVPVYKDSDYAGGQLKPGAQPYRKITITRECLDLILFMRNTYLRPTDIKVIRHRHITQVERAGIVFLELRHPATKRHSRVMTSTEYAAAHYEKICEARRADGFGNPDHHVFMPQHANRDYALKELTRQFDVVLRDVGLKADANGRARTLYSLRHTAIVAAIHAGISEQTLAMNARTSVAMIDRFYGSHVKSVLERGTEVVDRITAKHQRYAAKVKGKAKSGGHEPR